MNNTNVRKIPCPNCGCQTNQLTADFNNGLCAQCRQKENRVIEDKYKKENTDNKVLKTIGSVILITLLIIGWFVISLIQVTHRPYTFERIFSHENISEVLIFHLIFIIIFICIFLVWNYLKGNIPQYYVRRYLKKYFGKFESDE